MASECLQLGSRSHTPGNKIAIAPASNDHRTSSSRTRSEDRRGYVYLVVAQYRNTRSCRAPYPTGIITSRGEKARVWVERKTGNRLSMSTQYVYTAEYTTRPTTFPYPHCRIARTCRKPAGRNRNNGSHRVRVTRENVLDATRAIINSMTSTDPGTHLPLHEVPCLDLASYVATNQGVSPKQ